MQRCQILGQFFSFTISFQVGEAWDRCYWFWYVSDTEFRYCNFDLDVATGKVEMQKCDPESLGQTIEYSGTDKTECTITIHNVRGGEDLLGIHQGYTTIWYYTRSMLSQL